MNGSKVIERTAKPIRLDLPTPMNLEGVEYIGGEVSYPHV